MMEVLVVTELLLLYLNYRAHTVFFRQLVSRPMLAPLFQHDQ